MTIALDMMSNLDLMSASVPYMFWLRDLVKETVTLTMRVGLERMYIRQIPGIHELRQMVEIGNLYPLWNGAPGEAILAHLEEEEIEIVMTELKDSGVKVLASGQPLDANELRKSLGEIRQEGFAMSVGKRIPGVRAVSAPIFGFNRQVVGAVSIGGPAERFLSGVATQASSSLIEAASNISTQLSNFGH